MITVCLTYFRSLALTHLAAALYSVSRQDFSRVGSVVVVDNNTDDPAADIQAVIDETRLSVPVQLYSFKHGDPTRTHSWSTNVAVRKSVSPWVFFTRADYLLAADALSKFVSVVDSKRPDWSGFVTSNCYHMGVDIGTIERNGYWRQDAAVLRTFPGNEVDYTLIDTGVWLSTRRAFDEVGGLEEGLSAWGHAQTHYQYRLYKAGVEFERIPEPLYFHVMHGAERDIIQAHHQLRLLGGASLHEMWARYEGAKVY